MSGFKGPYFTTEVFGLGCPLATEMTIELGRHVSGIADLQPDPAGIFNWHSAGSVPATGGSTEIGRSLWEELGFASKVSGRRYEDKIYQAFFRLGNFDGITVCAFVAPFREMAMARKDEAAEMVVSASTPIEMFELQLRPDPKLTGDPLWNAASKSITLPTNAGRRVEVSHGLEMHIEGEDPNPVILRQCVCDVFSRLLPHVVVVDRRSLVATALVA